ncbi:MAG TPA: amidohydrolase family protein [Gemmataceae bacterium]|nr:amidohydrolase family protein [Gemmataceae bacterium]
MAPPEYNITGIDYADRRHFRYAGPLIDLHAHVMVTRPDDPPNAPPKGSGPGASTEQAALMLEVAADFGVQRITTMCQADDIPILRERFGNRLGFNGMINKKTADEPDDAVYRQLDLYLGRGVEMIKFWSAPRGRERGLLVDAPWRIEAAKRARAAGVRTIMVHVADPDAWFRTVYTDAGKYGTKESHYVGFERMMQLFPDITWIGAHMGGDVEHPDHLQALLEKYPHLYLDTSATKWQVREASRRPKEVQALICKFPERFFFGSDLVTRHTLVREHYVSRYWCQRTLWESDWQGPSPIADADYVAEPGEPAAPWLRGVALPPDVLDKVYYTNTAKLLEPQLVLTAR